jgi:transketolase
MPEIHELRGHFGYWETVKDLVDQLIDLMLNYRQSGHPGGSRSKVHMLTGLALSGAMRWDIRKPWKRYGDRFILAAGHTAPLGYALLAVLNEALKAKHARSGDARYAFADDGRFALLAHDLLGFRNQGGLPGHAEMAGKTLFYKWNTGPSGHGAAALVGEAFALKYAGADDVYVWGIEGEGGLTPGVNHEAMNSAWGLGLNNLHLLVDWNDYGIDDRPCSSVVWGGPQDWFASHGWAVHGTDTGNDWEGVADVLCRMLNTEVAAPVPVCGWMRTKKGRGYLKYDNVSHGAPHKMNSDIFWETKRPFADKYGVAFAGFGQPAPAEKAAQREQFAANIEAVMNVLRHDALLVDYLADTLVGLGDSIPEEHPRVWVDFSRNPLKDPAIFDFEKYPLYLPPGSNAPNRQGLSTFGAWLNSFCKEKYGRPLVIAASADLAESTNIAGFGKGAGDSKGWGWYERNSNPHGTLLPQEITEFVNAGLLCSMATVNFDHDPFKEFNGFIGAASTYGSFSYLKYGMVRVFSQLAQDCDLKVGKFIWVAGHSGPETAEDSRTHFGVFAPGVTQLLPKTQVINLYPFDHNEVIAMLGAALKEPEPVIALHVTRPPVSLPDRQALGMDSHLFAARGAYLIRDFDPSQPRMGTVLVQGTYTTWNLIKLLPTLKELGLNVRVVAATSPELFRKQPQEYKDRVLPWNEWLDSMVVTNSGLKCMSDWLSTKVAEEYSLSSDWDDRWRTGGSVDEVMEEAHLSKEWILKGIQRFVNDREVRLARLKG